MQLTTTAAVRSEPNVTPMVDVMLVLLIIFMVVIPALLDGGHLAPPTATNVQSRPPAEGEHTLAIDAAGRHFLDRRPIDAAALALRLRSLYPDSTQNRVLFLRADGGLDYRVVQDAMDLAGRNGVRVVALVAEAAAAPSRSPSSQ